MSSKQCDRCLVEKAPSEFVADKYSPDGLKKRCKLCMVGAALPEALYCCLQSNDKGGRTPSARGSVCGVQALDLIQAFALHIKRFQRRPVQPDCFWHRTVTTRTVRHDDVIKAMSSLPCLERAHLDSI